MSQTEVTVAWDAGEAFGEDVRYMVNPQPLRDHWNVDIHSDSWFFFFFFFWATPSSGVATASGLGTIWVIWDRTWLFTCKAAPYLLCCLSGPHGFLLGKEFPRSKKKNSFPYFSKRLYLVLGPH